MPLDFRGDQVRTHQIITSGSTGTNARMLVYDFSVASNNSGSINPALFNTSSIGTDNFIFFSGSVGSKDTTTRGVVVFNGDVMVSGSLYASGGNVQQRTRMNAAGYLATSASVASPRVAGQFYFNLTEHNNNNITFRVVMSVAGVITGSVALYNITSGTYVHIGGPGITTLSSSNLTPELKESVNLKTATNWGGSTPSIYEVQVYSSATPIQAILGGAEIITV